MITVVGSSCHTHPLQTFHKTKGYTIGWLLASTPAIHMHNSEALLQTNSFERIILIHSSSP